MKKLLIVFTIMIGCKKASIERTSASNSCVTCHTVDLANADTVFVIDSVICHVPDAVLDSYVSRLTFTRKNFYNHSITEHCTTVCH